MTDATPTDLVRIRRCFVTLVISLFVLYNLNLREIGVLDPLPATLLPVSLLVEGNADLDEFRELLAGDAHGRALVAFGTVQERDGHLVSSYPIGVPVLAVPFYALPVWLGWLDDIADYRLVAKLAASFMVALSAGLLFLAGVRIGGVEAALVAAITYGAASNAWTVASQALWQHGPGMLCLSAALLLVLRLERNGGARTALAAGVFLALAVACRSLNLIPSACLGLFVLVRHRRWVLHFGLPLILVGVWQGWYNVSTFGEIRGGHEAIWTSPWHGWRGLNQQNAFTHPIGAGVVNLLLNPNKGLLVYSPWAIFAIVGLAASLRSKEFPLSPYLSLWVVIVVVALAQNQLWWGGSGFGPRYFCELQTAFALVLAWLWPRIARRPFLRTGFAVCIAFSFAVQVIGAFYTPCGWHEEPVPIDLDESRLWDWRDPQLLRCLRAGPRPFEFLISDAD